MHTWKNNETTKPCTAPFLFLHMKTPPKVQDLVPLVMQVHARQASHMKANFTFQNSCITSKETSLA